MSRRSPLSVRPLNFTRFGEARLLSPTNGCRGNSISSQENRGRERNSHGTKGNALYLDTPLFFLPLFGLLQKKKGLSFFNTNILIDNYLFLSEKKIFRALNQLKVDLGRVEASLMKREIESKLFGHFSMVVKLS